MNECDGSPLWGTFCAEDLQKVTVVDDDLFHVDKIAKRKRGKVLVRRKEWPDKYDSWVDRHVLLKTE